ncbi:hypothetical protein [Actinokineospora sp. HUAS TT18]|uniref:hypothetical protein n=1 Tax=Actinokineospora sp. HUAS TT18 TaxID=3447451 RepID=UPI003F5242C0
MAIKAHSPIPARGRWAVLAVLGVLAWIRSARAVVALLEFTPLLPFDFDSSDTGHAPPPSQWDDFALWETEFAIMDGPA